MPSPYRESDNAPPAPLAELEWRRRVARSARWAAVLGAGGILLVLAGYWLPARFALAGAMAWLVVGAVLLVATWMYTAPRPRSAVGWRGWLLRASVAFGLGVTGLPLLGIHLGAAGFILGVLLVGATVPYIASFRKVRKVRVQWSRRQWLLYGAFLFVLTAITDYLVDPALQPAWRFLAVLVAGAAAWGAEPLRRTLLPMEHDWWFNNGTGTPGEWIVVFVYDDGLTELRWVNGNKSWFRFKSDAERWLGYYGYLPAERALAERLVDRVPTDTVPLLKPRKPARPRKDKHRVRDDEPRVRVAAEAEAIDREAEAIEEPALDDAEPPRAVTVRDPDDPRD